MSLLKMKYDNNNNIFYKAERYEFQKLLIIKYRRTLLSLIVDYPGECKNNNLSKNIISCMDGVLSDLLEGNIYMKIFRITGEGPVITILLDIDSVEAKSICDEVVSKHMLGCTVELEIFNSQGNVAEGTGIKDEEKKCNICGQNFSVCKGQKTHNQSELITRMNNLYIEYTNSNYGKTN
jgi:holo-ACP synthase